MKTVNLWVNENALSSTYLDSTTERTKGPNAFAIEPSTVPVDETRSLPGQPTFSATIGGITSNSGAYFYMDMTNSNTVVWTSDCMNTLDSPSTPCSETPLLMETQYQNQTDAEKSFTSLPFSGYTVSGSVYPDTICFGTRCTVISVYAGSEVESDTNLYGVDGAYGILGFGLSSPLWLSFIDPETNAATYSIALARATTQSFPKLAAASNAASSNVTLGSATIPDFYQAEESLSLTESSAYSTF